MNINRLRTKFVQENEMSELLCYKCNKYLSSKEFDCNSDHWYRQYKDRRCKTCKTLQRKRREELDHFRINLDRILLSRWHGLNDRANKKGCCVLFDWSFLKELWIKQEGKCALSGIDMTYEMFVGRIPTNVSVDRIDPSKGYDKDNIQLVCMAVNQMKSDMDLEQLLYFCEQIINKNE